MFVMMLLSMASCR